MRPPLSDPLRDEPIGAGRQGGVGLLGRAHLDEDSASESSPGGEVGGGRDDDGVDPFDQRDRGGRTLRRPRAADPRGVEGRGGGGRGGGGRREGLIGPAHHLGEGGGGHHGVTAQIEHPERTGPNHAHDQRGIRSLEGRHPDDQIPLMHVHPGTLSAFCHHSYEDRSRVALLNGVH